MISVEDEAATTNSHDRSDTGSPTTVTSANTIDWVSFLEETGSILALNDYMDTVLGVDDSMVPAEYDNVPGEEELGGD